MPEPTFYSNGLGYLQWPFKYLIHGVETPAAVKHTSDPTDLIALPALLAAWKL